MTWGWTFFPPFQLLSLLESIENILLFNFVFFKSMKIQHLCNPSKKNPYEELNKIDKFMLT
jgi:hypothetical protein